MILAGDIGGTKTNLGLFQIQSGALATVLERSYQSKDYPHFEKILDDFLKGHAEAISSAAFGIAAPIVDGHATAPNLPWSLSLSELHQKLNVEQIGLINDLQAMALGISLLPKEGLTKIKEGKPEPEGTRGVIAAGTGLGEAALAWRPVGYRVLPSEGGHGDFAPRNDLEIELLRFLLKKFGRVSYERVLSGPGLMNIYSFLRESRHSSEPPWLTAKIQKGDPSAAVTEAGLSQADPLCAEALDMFISIYGSEAGNLALNFLAIGGIYIGGGIAPKILPRLRSGGFEKAFVDKGRLAPVLAQIPVYVILETRTPLLGAAQHAFSLEAAR